ncbi:MAG TPA: hypothetical protein VIL86_09210 [Tepidisphaeraceae bacterium]|jgi:hypothetical protein
MDLTSSICDLQQAKVIGQVQMRVARKMLDVQQFQGAAAIKLIEAASKGAEQAGDALVAQATGLGGALDTYA